MNVCRRDSSWVGLKKGLATDSHGLTQIRKKGCLLDDHEFNVLTEQIIGCAYQVANTLGAGFLEKVYENALRIELTKRGLRADQQYPIKIYYEDVVVGEYFADLLVNDLVIIELKVQDRLGDVAMAQCLNYLRATGKTDLSLDQLCSKQHRD